MKRTPLLNRHVSALIARLGHLDEIVIGDAGLSAPTGLEVIDLAVVPGLPGFFDVLRAVRAELAIESAVHAVEASEQLAGRFRSELEVWGNEIERDITLSTMPHDAFKQRMGSAKALLRTGETTAYANLILVSGVVF